MSRALTVIDPAMDDRTEWEKKLTLTYAEKISERIYQGQMFFWDRCRLVHEFADKVGKKGEDLRPALKSLGVAIHEQRGIKLTEKRLYAYNRIYEVWAEYMGDDKERIGQANITFLEILCGMDDYEKACELLEEAQANRWTTRELKEKVNKRMGKKKPTTATVTIEYELKDEKRVKEYIEKGIALLIIKGYKVSK